MKKILTIFMLLLAGCYYFNLGQITINQKESNSISTIYDLNICDNMKIEIYELNNDEW